MQDLGQAMVKLSCVTDDTCGHERTANELSDIHRGVVVNLGERFPRPRYQQRGSLRPHARRVAVLGVGAEGGRPLPLRGSGDVTPGKFFGDFGCQIPRLGAIWAAS